LILGHNREDFREIPESIINKFLSIIDAGLFASVYYKTSGELFWCL